MTRARNLGWKILLTCGALLLLSPVLILIAFKVAGGLGAGGYYSIPSGSMEPTLRIGETILVLPYDRKSGPIRGSVVVFRTPADPKIEFVMRIIALPGERIALKDGRPVINDRTAMWETAPDYRIGSTKNGQGFERLCSLSGAGMVPTCLIRQWTEMLEGGAVHQVLDFSRTRQDEFPEAEVPAGHVFVLGDNRDNSHDSRFPGVGMIPLDNITGVVWRRFIARDADGIDIRRFMGRIE